MSNKSARPSNPVFVYWFRISGCNPPTAVSLNFLFHTEGNIDKLIAFFKKKF
jgi:hypothetical protein